VDYVNVFSYRFPPAVRSETELAAKLFLGVLNVPNDTLSQIKLNVDYFSL